eukprot:TRINITY_DN909_c0_g1_i1.p1 TRINITY_DN909_c0_g1~~TRINITY_DN909_c0_g1_i1.p1  ORF type:complete len:378 (+),score=103.81 TRINITY_DN909_c0_g1_i1:83-1216(+)
MSCDLFEQIINLLITNGELDICENYLFLLQNPTVVVDNNNNNNEDEEMLVEMERKQTLIDVKIKNVIERCERIEKMLNIVYDGGNSNCSGKISMAEKEKRDAAKKRKLVEEDKLLLDQIQMNLMNEIDSFGNYPCYPLIPLLSKKVHKMFLWIIKNEDKTILDSPFHQLAQIDVYKELLSELENEINNLQIERDIRNLLKYDDNNQTLLFCNEDCSVNKENLKTILKAILEISNGKFIQRLFNIRNTKGTLDISSKLCLPPHPNVLLNSFNSLYNPDVSLSTGARALCKHAVRDSSKFWGDLSKGSNRQKNEKALLKIIQIICDSSWINIHHLPHQEVILEIRTKEGYGGRWRADGSFFRGFLEPGMIDGHEKGWKH